MEDPNQSNRQTNMEIDGTWRQFIKVANEVTYFAFAHLKHN